MRPINPVPSHIKLLIGPITIGILHALRFCAFDGDRFHSSTPPGFSDFSSEPGK